MRTYIVIWEAGKGGSAVLLLDGKEIHRTAPSNYPDICGDAWVNGTWKNFRKTA